MAYLLSHVRGETLVITLVLEGIIIGSVFSALISLLKYISDDSVLREIVFWLIGVFYYESWSDVFVFEPVVIICLIILWILGWRLNILSMGDKEARTLGVNPEKYKLILITFATATTAFTVSFVGIIA